MYNEGVSYPLPIFLLEYPANMHASIATDAAISDAGSTVCEQNTWPMMRLHLIPRWLGSGAVHLHKTG
jgi:hypothetical protein